MARSIKAIINPQLLVWARKSANVSLADAAKKAGVGVATLESWEAGEDAPSIAKLRSLADNYKRPLSGFARASARLPVISSCSPEISHVCFLCRVGRFRLR